MGIEEEEACADDELVVKKEKSISISKLVSLPQSSSSSSSSSPPAADHHIPDSNPIGPPTPDFNRKPIIKGLLLLLDHGFSSNHTDGNSSETPPKETLFDSFAPGPDNLMLAPPPPPPPHHRKYYTKENELRIKHVVRRQLNFMCEIRDITTTSTTHMDSDIEHDHLFQIVYGTILDSIVSDHETKKEVVVGGGDGNGGFESGFDGFGTPVPHLLLCGIAETCPRAPIKSTTKYRNNIDKEICKKLEF
ncbi:hypothetical protein OROMI_029203 [Orobanche minor]